AGCAQYPFRERILFSAAARVAWCRVTMGAHDGLARAACALSAGRRPFLARVRGARRVSGAAGARDAGFTRGGYSRVRGRAMGGGGGGIRGGVTRGRRGPSGGGASAVGDR